MQNSSKLKEENDLKEIYYSRDLNNNQRQERRAARATRSDGLGSPDNLTRSQPRTEGSRRSEYSPVPVVSGANATPMLVN